jgi:hypothetical protein
MRGLSDNRAEEVGCTRFFRNERVRVTEIIETAAARTAEAAAGRDVLVIEDSSEINYESKRGRKRGLGRVGNGTGIGLFVHPALVVDAHDGSVLGLRARPFGGAPRRSRKIIRPRRSRARKATAGSARRRRSRRFSPGQRRPPM